MNLFAKTGPWVAASLIATASIFGQNSKCAPAQKSFEQGHEMTQSQMMAGYNAPSRIEVRGSWDVFATGSFTYWQPIQENMELGAVYSTASVGTDANIVNPNFNYKPGFKVGLGMNFDHDNWDTFVEYTWFRGTHSTTTSLDSTLTSRLRPLRLSPEGLATYYNGANQSWKLHMDILDWELARSSYVGTKLTFRPFFAARATWIRQNLSSTYEQTSGVVGSNILHSNKSQSWAVGPRAGLYTNWMLGEGFRMYGNGAGDILFTQYTKLKSAQSTQVASVVTNQLTTRQNKLNTIRTHLDLELGFAWGSYFDNNNWHVDLSAGYGFQVFFDQNMFRFFTDGTNVATSLSPNGNLYVHGLTATARFDF